MIKTIINEHDGTSIEAKILRKIQQHIFMLYPMSGVHAALISIANEKNHEDGIYIYLIGYGADFFMRIPETCLIKTITFDTYDPFFEEEPNKELKKYIKKDEEIKKSRSKVIDLKNKKDKMVIEVSFKSEKKHFLKRIVGALGL